MRQKRFFVVLVVLAFTATAAMAQIGQKPELVLTLSVQKEVIVTGEGGEQGQGGGPGREDRRSHPAEHLLH